MVLPASLVAFAPSAGDARNAVPAPGAEEHGVILSGSGATVRRVELAAGLWTVMMEVTENAETCGFSVPADFVVTIESGDAGAPRLANEIAARWSGSATLRVGKGLKDVAPGRRRLDDHLSQRVRDSQIRQGPFGSGRRAEERKARDLGIRYGHPALATRPGLWTVSLEVRGNTDTTFGPAIPDDFVASIEIRPMAALRCWRTRSRAAGRGRWCCASAGIFWRCRRGSRSSAWTPRGPGGSNSAGNDRLW